MDRLNSKGMDRLKTALMVHTVRSKSLPPTDMQMNQKELSFKNNLIHLFVPPQASSHNAPVFLKGVKIKGLVHACMHDLVKIVFFLKRM